MKFDQFRVVKIDNYLKMNCYHNSKIFSQKEQFRFEQVNEEKITEALSILEKQFARGAMV